MLKRTRFNAKYIKTKYIGMGAKYLWTEFEATCPTRANLVAVVRAPLPRPPFVPSAKPHYSRARPPVFLALGPYLQ